MKMGIAFGAVTALVFGLTIPYYIQRNADSGEEKTPASTVKPQPSAKEEAKEPREKKTPDLPPIPPENKPLLRRLADPPKEPIRLATLPKENAKLSGQQIYEKALKSTVWINNPGMGFGSGTLINAEEKLVLTNYHVVFRRTNTQKGKVIHVINNSVAETDPRDKQTNLPCKIFEVQLSAKNGYVFDMESKEIDSFLQISDVRNQILASDDDSGGNLNARIYFIPPHDGKYRILATTYAGGFGKFTLKISQIDFKGRPPTTGFAVAPYLLVNFPELVAGKVNPEKNYYMGMINVDREKYKAKVVAWNEAKDLAVLKLNHLPKGVVPLPLAKESSQPGQLVHSIGNPGDSGTLWVYTSGTVRTAPYHKVWQSSGLGGKMSHDAVIIETQSPTNPGDSGGPLVNENLELVAVTQGSTLFGNSISLFVDVQEVRAFLQANRCRWVERSISPTRD